MTPKLRNKIFKRLMDILHDGQVPWTVRCTPQCSRAIERVTDEIKFSDNPGNALNTFVSQWARN